MTTQHGGSALTNADLAGAAADPQALDLKKAARIARNERCMGSGLIANLVAMAADDGVDRWIASPAIRLIGEERVEGVLVEREAGLCRIQAKDVVLATSSEERRGGKEGVRKCSVRG